MGLEFKFHGGTAGVLSTTANAVDFMSCYYDGLSDTLDCVLNRRSQCSWLDRHSLAERRRSAGVTPGSDGNDCVSCFQRLGQYCSTSATRPS